MKLKHIPLYIKLAIQNNCRRNFINPRMRKKLRNHDFSIISSTCNGGVLTSDLGVRFNSPTVNLSIKPKDYLKMISDLEYYMQSDLRETYEDGIKYPIGLLNDEITLYFVHYKSFQEAKEKWENRKARINYNNLFFMMTDRDGCTYTDIELFNSLPLKNKLIFTCKKYDEFKTAIWCEEYKYEEEVPVLTNFRNLKGERLYDRYFNFVEWLNNGKNE